MKLQYAGNYRSNGSSSGVSPVVLTQSKGNPTIRVNYNSVNAGSSSAGNEPGALNVSAHHHEGPVGSSSGASTPSHLSQQNLIKIMKKIKSSNPVATSSSIANKENIAVAPPNIITNQSRGNCADSLHPSVSTTPTAEGPHILHAQSQNLLSKHMHQQAIQS